MSKRIVLNKCGYERNIENIANWNVHASVKKDVKEFFADYLRGEVTGNISSGTNLEQYIFYLRTVLEYINKPLQKMTHKEIRAFCDALLKDEIMRKCPPIKPISESVKIVMRRLLLKLLEWKITDEKKLAVLTKPLRVKAKQKLKTPEALSESEIDRLYDACKDNAERYLIAVLFSSGTRIGEFVNIRKSDIQLPKDKQNFVKITIREQFSKTKGRTISLYYKYATEAVENFLRERIREGIEDEEAVWVKSYAVSEKRFRSIAKRAKIEKNIHAHLFRSSAATHLANKLNRQELCYYFGWKFSSPMPDTYIQREGILIKEADEKMSSGEIDEMKSKIKGYEHESKLKDEKIDKLISIVDDLQKFKERTELKMNDMEKDPKRYFYGDDGLIYNKAIAIIDGQEKNVLNPKINVTKLYEKAQAN
jgi:integrase